MPVIRRPGQLPLHAGRGWRRRTWADAAVFGVPVPMTARRYTVDPGAAVPHIPLAGPEALAYVISGSGTARAGGDGFTLARESVLWLAAGGSALADAGEVHWFENDRAAEFAFVEFWAPPPASTVWTVAGDRCTWAPAN